MPLWPLPGGSVSDPASNQNFTALASKGGEVEHELDVIKKEGPIVGQVSSAGALVIGTGFTSERTAEGRYTITLDTELPTTGIIVPTLFGGSGQIRVATQGKKEFTVECVNIAQSAFQDNAFNFVIKAS